ncbi:MAG TPA: SDR family NAD(P)-dependent oxidoreductase [Acidimicrobiales bacterium]|nr:SDR family NAD(P)-dependent oxidoreductase [Acidimicrobiales bacterium]
MTDEGFRGRVILVTGASSGIGLATAAGLVDVGARVHAVARRAQLAEERLGAQRLATGLLTVHQLDVTNHAAVKLLVDRVGGEGPLEALVCCAGTNIPDRRFDQLTDASWRLLLETNLTGVFSCIRASLPQLRRTRGHVVVVSSVSALWPDASGPAYQSSKAGVLALVRAAALEENKSGIRFTSVLPGVVATEILDKRPEPPPPEVRAQCLQPEDVAATIIFALSLPERACVAEMTVLPTALQVLGRT